MCQHSDDLSRHLTGHLGNLWRECLFTTVLGQKIKRGTNRLGGNNLDPRIRRKGKQHRNKENGMFGRRCLARNSELDLSSDAGRRRREERKGCTREETGYAASKPD